VADPHHEGAQFGSGFVAVNPNSKIPALLDRTDPANPVRVFESGAILMYLAEKFGAFLPKDGAARAECLSWLFWQMGSAPFVGGGFGHFYAYAPVKIEYAIDRYAMEVKRQLDVLNQRLAVTRVRGGQRVHGGRHGDLALVWAAGEGQAYDAGEFLQVHEYTHVVRWAEQVAQRPAVQRGRKVNRVRATWPASCASGTTPATLTPRRRTSWLQDGDGRQKKPAAGLPRRPGTYLGRLMELAMAQL
jgi:GST-like protein